MTTTEEQDETYEYRLADAGNRLARRRRRKVDRQIRLLENLHQWNEALVHHELTTVVIRRVIAQDCFDKFHLQFKSDGHLNSLMASMQ